MDFIYSNNITSIDLIIGPMYAAKTTELIRRLNIYSEMGLKVLYINSNLDDRCSDNFSTHNPTLKSIGKIDSLKITKLLSIIRDSCMYDVIGIDEGQLFNDLKEFTLTLVERYGKKVIIAGLNGDFKRESFGDILNMIPLCDGLTKLTPFCQLCASKHIRIIRQAQFTKRISSDKDTVVIIGGKTTYIPVCRECYNL